MIERVSNLASNATETKEKEQQTRREHFLLYRKTVSFFLSLSFWPGLYLQMGFLPPKYVLRAVPALCCQ